MGSEIPKHYADIVLPSKSWKDALRRIPSGAWRGIGKIPVFADVIGVVVALGVGVTGVEEYAGSLALLCFGALALSSRLWHSDNVSLLKGIGTFFIACGLLAGTLIVWDAKGDKDWSRLPHAWHRLMAMTTTTNLNLPPAPPTPGPNFYHDIRFSHTSNYRTGINVDGIRWTSNMREYILTIGNDTEVGEISNFREHIYFPFPIRRVQTLSSLGSDGVSTSLGQHGYGGLPSAGLILDDNDRAITTTEDGINDMSVAATRMLPGAVIVLKMIADAKSKSVNSKRPRGVMIYGSEYTVSGKTNHYGRMVRYIDGDSDDGAVVLGDVFHKKGHPLKITIVWSFNVTKNNRGHQQETPESSAPFPDMVDRDDDN